MIRIAFITLMVVCTSLNNSLFSQTSVNVDNQRFKYYIRSLPTQIMDSRSFYYSVNFAVPLDVRRFLDERLLAENVIIEGQRFTDSPQRGDAAVSIIMSPVNFETATVKERYVEEKDSRGKVTGRTFYYWQEVVYTFESSTTISQNNKEYLRYSAISRSKKYTFKSPEFSRQREASRFYIDNRQMLLAELTRERAEETVDLVSKKLTNTFGFPVTAEYGLIKTINEKKHPEHYQLREMSLSIEKKMRALDGTYPLTEADMEKEIEYFKSLPVKYADQTPKLDARLRYVAYYNLARIYMYIDQPENTKEWADLLTENGVDKKDGETLIKDARTISDRFIQSDIYTREFDPDTLFSE
ncbi:hypothetical protein [Dysgonomonas macrotermitis]|uniref:Uncharacterized protein n=1 Tax=Dysgonomonas macrotermitis TaxID=1346286 RepID=A0A1M5H4M2_9BACT|nr:hypothetical protein [Dysgonomonas macrotermitis]SHG10833.1 hypothetical protein SAMN05444362_11584 [Dysgonomonas macrotermitis]